MWYDKIRYKYSIRYTARVRRSYDYPRSVWCPMCQVLVLLWINNKKRHCIICGRRALLIIICVGLGRVLPRWLWALQVTTIHCSLWKMHWYGCPWYWHGCPCSYTCGHRVLVWFYCVPSSMSCCDDDWWYTLQVLCIMGVTYNSVRTVLVTSPCCH